MRLIGLAGWSGSGKTTLLAKVLPVLIARGRTVAHRLSAVRVADRIITIERGRITEDGTHDELIKKGGRYATLYRLQAGLHEIG